MEKGQTTIKNPAIGYVIGKTDPSFFVSQYDSKTSGPSKALCPDHPAPEISVVVSRCKKQMSRNYETLAIAPRVHKTKWMWEKSAIL